MQSPQPELRSSRQRGVISPPSTCGPRRENLVPTKNTVTTPRSN
jgi:hypothetical protein